MGDPGHVLPKVPYSQHTCRVLTDKPPYRAHKKMTNSIKDVEFLCPHGITIPTKVQNSDR